MAEMGRFPPSPSLSVPAVQPCPAQQQSAVCLWDSVCQANLPAFQVEASKRGRERGRGRASEREREQKSVKVKQAVAVVGRKREKKCVWFSGRFFLF